MGWGERGIIYLSLHCHHQNDFCIKVGSDESHLNVSVGSDVSYVQVTYKGPLKCIGWGRVQELCESRGGRPGLSVLMSLMVSVDVKHHVLLLIAQSAEFRSCVKVEVAVLMSLMISVDVKQH